MKYVFMTVLHLLFLSKLLDGCRWQISAIGGLNPLQPNKRYQLNIGSGFRDKSGKQLRPYLVDLTTAGK